MGQEKAMAIRLQQPTAVVILTCTANVNVPQNWTVALVDASINSPSISPGGSCAAALQTLISGGFEVGKLAADNQGPFTMVYTMVHAADLVLN